MRDAGRSLWDYVLWLRCVEEACWRRPDLMDGALGRGGVCLTTEKCSL